MQAQFGCEPASDLFWKTEWFGLRIVEALLAAGYRPCAWQHVRMPAFLQPTHRERVLPVLDPFLLYDPVESAVSGLPMACCYLLVHPADFSQFKVTKRYAGSLATACMLTSHAKLLLLFAFFPNSTAPPSAPAGWSLWRAADAGALRPTATGQSASRPQRKHFCSLHALLLQAAVQLRAL